MNDYWAQCKCRIFLSFMFVCKPLHSFLRYSGRLLKSAAKLVHMKINIHTTLLFASFFCSQLAKAQGDRTSITDTAIIANGATPQLVSREFQLYRRPGAQTNRAISTLPISLIIKYGSIRPMAQLSCSSTAPADRTVCISTEKATCISCADEQMQLMVYKPQ